MKRILLSVLMLLLIFSSACSGPTFFPDDNLDEKWGDVQESVSSDGALPTVEPTVEPTIEPTPEPTPLPSVTLETATEQTLTLSFSFGDCTGVYTGTMMDGLPEGNGAFTVENDDGLVWTYTGGWAAGHMSGMGTTAWSDGFSESGTYQNDQLNGQGQESWYGVVQYEGEYQEGKYHGEGTYYNNYNEIVYSGSFSEGRIQESAEDRSNRVGAFKDESVPLDIGDLYGSCQEEISMRVKTEGRIFDVWYYPSETEPNFCDILIYEQGVEDTERIICVYYLLSVGETPPAEDQSVTVWGTTESLYTYTSVSYEELTVPLIEAWSIE